MSSDFLTTFLASILHEQGCPNPREVAQKAADDLLRAKLADPKRVEVVEKHRKIDLLRAQGVSCTDIAVRLGMTRPAVSKIVTEQLELRRVG